MGRVTERVVDAVNLALILNQISSGMAASQKNVDVASQVINETVKAINAVNQKIAEKQKQQAPLISLMKQKQKQIDDLKKVFKNHSYHGIQDAQREYDDARNKSALLESDINALKTQLSGLTAKKQQAERNKAAAEKAKSDAATKAATEKAAAEAKAKAEAEKARKEAEEKARDEKEALTKTSELIADMGDKIGEHLGDKYKAVAKEIADDIKNFQGKSLRTHEQTMASLNKIISNPNLKVNQGDKDALINAWKSLNAGDMANKLGNLSRAFKVADIALKAEKVREKSIHGYETGDWGPLMLEVESWVLSGVAAGVAIGLFGAILSMLPVSGLALTAITIVGIMAISYLSSKIDDKIAEKINNEVIRPAN